jgi:hypothetical protein
MSRGLDDDLAESLAWREFLQLHPLSPSRFGLPSDGLGQGLFRVLKTVGDRLLRVVRLPGQLPLP